MEEKIRKYDHELNLITRLFKEQNKELLENLAHNKQFSNKQKTQLMSTFPKPQNYFVSVIRSYASEEFQRIMCD